MEAVMWRDAKTDLPESCKRVVICLSTGAVLFGQYLSARDEWEALGEKRFPVKNVTHWMPCEPPEGMG